MKRKLAYKIFATFSVAAAVIGALFVGVQYVAVRNFADYVNRVELDKFQDLQARLTAIYARDGTWGSLENNREGWRDVLEGAEIDMRPSDDPHPEGKRPPPPGPPGRRPPRDETSRDHRPSPHRDPPPRPQQTADLRIGPRLALFDASQRPIVGPQGPVEEFSLHPIQAGDRTIGWLGLHRIRGVTNPLAELYTRRQWRVFFLAGAAALVVTALVTLFLSRQILGPIKDLTAGAQSLSSRDFGKRVSVQGQDELGQMAEAFNAMSETLGRYETMRRQWISDISHELRTPLTALRGKVEALQDGIWTPDDESLASLHAETVRIGKLVEDLHLLSLADSEGLMLHRSNLDPIHVLRETVALFQERLDARGLRLGLDVGGGTGTRMQGDPDRLRQVFSNILDNALRHADAPGTLHIRARSRGERLTIWFEDSGPGVPTASLGRLFDRLYRVDRSRSRDSGGSGLGLAICRQIVEAHGGDIEAEHSPLGGLSIRIRLTSRMV